MRQPYLAAALAAGVISCLQNSLPAAAVSQANPTAPVSEIAQANRFFISQYRSLFNPQASEANSNCGPCSLAMALKRFFTSYPQIEGSDPERLVRLSRLAMTGRDDPDGNTDNFDVLRGARRLGLTAGIAVTLAGVDAVLDAGGLAIVSGSPSAPGSFAYRLGYRHCRGGHFIVIAGKRGGVYLMNDPESLAGAFEISARELRAFMSYWPPDDGSLHGAVTLWPGGQPNQARIAELEQSVM